ncbi:lysozyme inhibitor LprI family protein [uncultured Paracoccus sp.]|uniref:lysozyme inhibitor LprI family protein n=1 Tax=uncultured Paracoccus sp. TaxID=189685 RepID=UPI00260AA5F7|nr:lysozyme inhibitor LprI family protein [uncultured Paracoccus sp.]
MRLALATTCLLLAAPLAEAQEPAFDGALIDACLVEQSGRDGQLQSCIGVAADACIDQPAGDSTVGMTGCLMGEYQHWDGLLNSAYAEVMQKAEANDAELKQLGSAAEAEAPLLKEMQRKWIAFRDAACNWERSKWGGGTGGGPASAQCAMTLTAEQYLRLASRLREGG